MEYRSGIVLAVGVVFYSILKACKRRLAFELAHSTFRLSLPLSCLSFVQILRFACRCPDSNYEVL